MLGMVVSASFDAVEISVSDDVATVRRADGSGMKLPVEVLHRSSLLHQAISDTAHEEVVSLQLPQGVMDAWVEGLHAVHVDTRMPHQERACKTPKHCPSSRKLLNCLEASDFLVDKATVRQLCTQISHALFAPMLESGERRTDPQLEQDLLTLPSNLQHIVRTGSNMPALLQLWLLPADLHQAALHAAFPSITATSSLTVPYPMHSLELADRFWQVLGNETGLTSLTLTHRLSSSELLSEPFLACIAKLTCLEHFSVKELRICSDLERLVSCLDCQSSLKVLNLSRNYFSVPDFSQEAIECLTDHLVKLTALRSLDISENSFVAFEFEALGACIAQLPYLQSLNVSRSWSDFEDIAELAKYIPRFRSLQTFSCKGYASKTAILRLIQSLPSCSQLQTLKLPMCPLVLGSGASLTGNACKELRKLSDLQVLKLGEVSLRDLQALAGSITSLKQLHTFHVQFHDSPEGAAALTNIVTALPCLQDIAFLRAVDNRGENGVEQPNALARCVARAGSLRHIILSGSLMQIDGLVPSFVFLKGFKDLQSLKLRGITMGEAGARALAEVLPHLPSILQLDLSSNELHDTSLKHLAGPLGALSALQTLALSCTVTDGDGVHDLALQFSKLASMRELRLRCHGATCGTAAVLGRQMHLLKILHCLHLAATCPGESGVIQTASAIGTLTTLKELSLFGIEMTNACVEVLCSQITHLVALEYLDVSSNRIDDEGMRVLAKCARSLPSLQCIDVQDNRIGPNTDPYLPVIVDLLDDQFY